MNFGQAVCSHIKCMLLHHSFVQAAFGMKEEAVETSRMGQSKGISKDTFSTIGSFMQKLSWGFSKADVRALEATSS